MSQLQLKKMAKDLLEQAEREGVPRQRLDGWLDSYFIGELKRAEMEHAEVDARLYEGLRGMARAEVAPLYEQYRAQQQRIQQRRQGRNLWKYVLGTLLLLEAAEVILSRGRSLLPQILIPTAIFYSFIGFLLYSAAQYVDDRQLSRARARFQASFEHLERKIETDAEYDARRDLLQSDVLRAEVLEILVHYSNPNDFWRDYRNVREADPSTPSALAQLRLPAFEKFMKFHVQGGYSALARQHRFNRLFLEAQEIFVSRNREQYVLQHLKNLESTPS